MRDKNRVQFLNIHLPRLGLHWADNRKVRRTVCKRLGRRLRELTFTYFDQAGQAEVLSHLDGQLRPGGYLVIGSHERMPEGAKGYTACDKTLPIFREASVPVRL